MNKRTNCRTLKITKRQKLQNVEIQNVENYRMSKYKTSTCREPAIHCIHTMSHWSSGLPICFPSWGTRVLSSGGYLCETGILLLACLATNFELQNVEWWTSSEEICYFWYSSASLQCGIVIPAVTRILYNMQALLYKLVSNFYNSRGIIHFSLIQRIWTALSSYEALKIITKNTYLWNPAPGALIYHFSTFKCFSIRKAARLMLKLS
jgi:hypothetical protein